MKKLISATAMALLLAAPTQAAPLGGYFQINVPGKLTLSNGH